MVNSEKGITNLHVPSDIIIDASMPAALRNSARMWGPDGELHETKFVIPDSSYAGIYHKVLEFCDPRIQNIQSMAGNLLKFDIVHHSLILYGKCQKENCENKVH